MIESKDGNWRGIKKIRGVKKSEMRREEKEGDEGEGARREV